ncbi:hypothetical protein AG1IA_05607 [Rhizoctonia solani AG-1 IA]|uniref:Uncharacterized protein n=1 Tax=Thanatephorus cucumeris (strain AG1-IA) TaxID=983506 RepID=L8WQG0_THACA|nr:hypothetical protein AG1IA_05607 [Rhizoctonia solani AG-1 IA]
MGYGARPPAPSSVPTARKHSLANSRALILSPSSASPTIFAACARGERRAASATSNPGGKVKSTAGIM